MKNFTGFINYKSCLFRAALVILLTSAAYFGANLRVLRNWNTDDSLVVEILDAGSETLLPFDGQEGDQGGDEPFQTTKTELFIRILTGAQAGQNFLVVVTQMKGSGLELKKGGRYILIADVFEDGTTQYSVTDVFRIPSVAALLVFACACLTAFAGRAGAMALAGLGLSIACLLWGMVPLAVKGYPPVPLAFLAVVFISAATIFCVVRRKRERKVALLGTLGGAAGSWLVGFLMVRLWQLSGLAGESASLLFTTIAGVDMKGILLASIMVSAIGAVLDVGISITASMSELLEYDPAIDLFRLWSAGTRVGSEVLGSMINTLILAYIGTSLPVAMLISNAGADFWGLMNDPYVGQEIVQSIAGTSGLLLTIPITAAFFVLQEKISRGK